MATSIFVSPGVYTKEQDFTFFASRIGITKLGVVGLTLKGPAFEPIKISTTEEFAARFGATDTTLALPYVANSFLKQSSELTVTRVLGQVGFTNSNAWCILASGGTGDKIVLAVIRSKSVNGGSSFIYSAPTDIKMYGATSALGTFSLSAATGPLTAFTNSSVTVSLDESSASYMPKALGKNPLTQTGDYGIYVESIYPHYIREAISRGDVLSIYTGLTYVSDSTYTNYAATYKNSVTPWIVSKVVGNAVRNLFKVETISDGDSSAKEVKISIANIDEVNNTFDLIVRNFTDTDSNTAISGRLEMFRQLTMDDSQQNFIGRVIGTTNEDYPIKSSFITITMADNFPRNTVPAGFRGYSQRYSASTVNAPGIYYKTSYLSGDTESKTYLGLSELAYTSFTTSLVSVARSIQSVEADLFKYQGAVTDSGLTTIKGFHMESGAPTSEFVTGPFNSITGWTKSQRKFTVAPAGGFDGWQKYDEVGFDDKIDLNNIEAFKDAIDTMATPEAIDINILATPGVNFSGNQTVVKYALAMVEDRADSLYIIDSPRVSTTAVKGTAAEVVNALAETAIDSNYAATYWPWIQIEDAYTAKYVYISPTAEVVKSIAYTDNVAYPWFVPGGVNRGKMSANVVRADVRLTRDDRDVLYDGRVNPINTTIQDGIVIWGQKTLQIKQSALDRINVRRLMLQVRRVIAAAAITLVFEQNDQTTRDQFLAKVQPILLQIQNQRGLTAFRVTVDDISNGTSDSDRNTLTGKIQIKPTPALEFVDLTFQVLPTGASFEDF